MDAKARRTNQPANDTKAPLRKANPPELQRPIADSVPAEKIEKAHAQIRDQLRRLFESVADDCAAELAASGKDLDDLGGPVAVASAVRAVLPRANRFAERVGPVYTTGQLQVLLPGLNAREISDQAVRNRLEHGRLIGAKTRDNRWVFPTFQFHVRPGKLDVRDEVLELWSQLPAGDGTLDDWTLLAWLLGARKDLDGHSPLEWLDEHGLDQRLARATGRVRARAVA